MIAALLTEALKLRRSRVPWLTAAALVLPALMAGLFVLAARSTRDTSGLVGGKVRALGVTSDWTGYFTSMMQIAAVGGLVVFGILTAWVFGREFSDRTVAGLLALPTARSAIVVAKFIVIAAWSAVLTALVLVAGVLVGSVLGLPNWSPDLLRQTAANLAIISGLNALLVTPVAFAASVGRGYLPAIGLILLVIVAANALATVGVGVWFPWSVPALAGGVAGPAAAASVGPVSYLLVGLTSLAGVALTLTWWRGASPLGGP